MKDLYKRLAKAEAMAEFQKSELTENITEAYRKACEEHNEDDAAFFARKLRNIMLAESDSQMSFDRMGLSVPSGTTFTSWLAFFKKLGETLTGEWAQYRKSLRDLPEQAGFPFDVVFPEKPSDK